MAALQVHTLDEFTYRQNLLNFLRGEETGTFYISWQPDELARV
jgi:hypothetical protein